MSKTPTMRRIERQYGKPIEEILRELYVDNNMTIEKIAEELYLADKTVWTWLKNAQIKRRKMKWE